MTEPPSLSPSFLNDVRAILREARGKAYAAANAVMVEKHYALRSELSWSHWRLVMWVEDSQACG